MALSQIVDVSQAFVTGGPSTINIDLSGWDSATIQLVSPSGAINFLGSNDSGSITGAVEGNPTTAINFTALEATNLATNAVATSGAASGLWKLVGLPKFLQLSGTTITATKVLVYLSKIY